MNHLGESYASEPHKMALQFGVVYGVVSAGKNARSWTFVGHRTSEWDQFILSSETEQLSSTMWTTAVAKLGGPVSWQPGRVAITVLIVKSSELSARSEATDWVPRVEVGCRDIPVVFSNDSIADIHLTFLFVVDAARSR